MESEANLSAIEPAGPHSEIARHLGSDLWSLVSSVGIELTAATPIIGGTYPGYRSNAFCLRFADGRILKGRRLDTPAQAELVEHLSNSLGYRGLPHVLARFGTALLSAWIEGQPLGVRNCDSIVLRRCGALHGFAHSRPFPAGRPTPPTHTMEEWRAILRRRLDDLLQSALIDPGLAGTAAELAGAHAPASCASGFTYGDFCADNIVLHPSGEVFLVDTETLAIRPYDYDVGRTWYRWPMQRDERQAYFSGYLEHRQLTEFRAHFLFWAILAIVDGALFRGRRGGVAAATVPLQRLHRLVDNLQRGVTAEDAVFLS